MDKLAHADLILHCTLIKAFTSAIYEIADAAGCERDPIECRDEIGKICTDIEAVAHKLAVIAQTARIAQ